METTLPTPVSPWLPTYTGQQWQYTTPRACDVHITDIAHALSHLCRFNGHTREFYSVAQHSAIVCGFLMERYPDNRNLHLHGLLHDASEAYLGDICRPLKKMWPQYHHLETAAMAVIFEGLNERLTRKDYPAITPLRDYEAAALRYADDGALSTERRDLIAITSGIWEALPPPYHQTIEPLSPKDAKNQFLALYALIGFTRPDTLPNA